jgi:hypothetical protein
MRNYEETSFIPVETIMSVKVENIKHYADETILL